MSDRLKKLAKQIKQAEGALLKSVRTSLEHARRIGELLLEARKLVKRGQWGRWVLENCTFEVRMSQYYMTLAERWEELGDTKSVASLTVAQAIGLLTKKKEKNQAENKTEKAPEQPQAEAVIQESASQASQNRPETASQERPTLPLAAAPEPLALKGLMRRHGLVGTATGLLGLLAELGLDGGAVAERLRTSWVA